MQKCKQCHVSFGWSQIYKSFWGWAYPPIICNYCGTKHKIAFSGRIAFVSLTILPSILFMNFISPFDNILLTLAVGLLILFPGSLLAPYIVRYE